MSEVGKLLPCPFCGSDDVDRRGWLAADGRHGPQCQTCGATAETAEAWNRRAPRSSPTVAQVEKLAEEWVNRAVAVHAGERPCNVKEYRTAFLTALRALGEAEWSRAIEAAALACEKRIGPSDAHNTPYNAEDVACAKAIRALRRGEAG